MFIPAPLEDARFRKSEQFLIKTDFLLRVIQENMLRIIAPALSNKVLPVPSVFTNKLLPCSALKKKCNAEYDLLRLPQRAGLEKLYAALLILIRE